MIRILGIDPGTRVTGYGVIELDDLQSSKVRHIEHGVIRVPEKLSLAHRLSQLFLELTQIYERFRPDETAIEKVFLGKSADSAFKLGHARGVCLSVAAQFKSEIFEYAARSVKKVVTGQGGAEKEHVRLIVLAELGISSEAALDATDALALAICHSRSRWALEVERRLVAQNVHVKRGVVS